MILLNPHREYRLSCFQFIYMVYYAEKVRHDLPKTPYGCPHWFRSTKDWFYWRRPRSANASKLKKAVDALFRGTLERRSNPLAYPASLVCQHQAHNLVNGEAISNYFSSTFWAEVTLDKDLSDEDDVHIFAQTMLDLICEYCHNEVHRDLAYNLYTCSVQNSLSNQVSQRKRFVPG
jgi:hypothetical protein